MLTGYWPQIAGASFESLDGLTAYAQIPGALYLADPLSTFGQTEPYYYDGHWAYFRYLDELAYDIASEQLPAISFAIAGPDANEAPGKPSSLTDGVAFARESQNRSPSRHATPRKRWSSSPISRVEGFTIT